MPPSHFARPLVALPDPPRPFLSLSFPLAAALLVIVGFIAGTVNVLAGGGSLLTLPVLIFLRLVVRFRLFWLIITFAGFVIR